MTDVTFPISIAVVGAPGVGKLSTGIKFAEISEEYFDANDSHLALIENSGRTISQDFDQALGVFGSWSDDLRTYFHRYEQEEMSRAKGVSFITLGTAIENIAHSGVNLESIITGLTTPDQEVKTQRYQIAMTAMTFLFQVHFRYMFGFYIPHPGTSIILPGEPDTEDEYNQRVDKAIQVVMDNFGLRLQVLNQPTPEEKAEEMLATVKRIVENGPDLPPSAESDIVVEDAIAE